MLCLAGVPCRWLHLGVVIQRSFARAVTSIDFTCCSMAYVVLNVHGSHAYKRCELPSKSSCGPPILHTSEAGLEYLVAY
jgi:hypothetical protein